MSDTAIKRRQRYAKGRTLSHLRAIYPRVIPQPVPDYIAGLYFVPKIKSFFAVCVDDISDKASAYLGGLKKDAALDISVFVHVYLKDQKGTKITELL